jgi:hypothetical protein
MTEKLRRTVREEGRTRSGNTPQFNLMNCKERNDKVLLIWGEFIKSYLFLAVRLLSDKLLGYFFVKVSEVTTKDFDGINLTVSCTFEFNGLINFENSNSKITDHTNPSRFRLRK